MSVQDRIKSSMYRFVDDTPQIHEIIQLVKAIKSATELTFDNTPFVKVYIYGGFIRDVIAGIESIDIDVKLVGNNSMTTWKIIFKNLITNLQKLIPNMKILTELDRNSYQNLSLLLNDIKFDITMNPKPSKLDFTVNTLMLDLSGNITTSSTFTLEEIYNHIINKKLIQIDAVVDSHRLEKMLSKGYSFPAEG